MAASSPCPALRVLDVPANPFAAQAFSFVYAQETSSPPFDASASIDWRSAGPHSLPTVSDEGPPCHRGGLDGGSRRAASRSGVVWWFAAEMVVSSGPKRRGVRCGGAG